MGEGYHRLCSQLMAVRDDEIIRLVNDGVKHYVIAFQVGLQPTGMATRLHKLRELGKLPAARGKKDG